MVVDSELDFGNSWKEAPTCPDVSSTPEPCVLRPHRLAWAEKQCSIIKSSVFSSCHSKVCGPGGVKLGSHRGHHRAVSTASSVLGPEVPPSPRPPARCSSGAFQRGRKDT